MTAPDESVAAEPTELPSPDSAAASAKRGNRRAWWLMSALLALILTGMTQREFIGQSFARFAMARLDGAPRESIERYLMAAETIAPSIAEADLVRTRMARREGNFDAADRFLTRAKYRGGANAQLELERWLITAQRGQTEMAEQQLPVLLEEHGDEATEICRAFVLGYLRERRFGPAMMMLDGWRDNAPEAAEPIAFQGQVHAELQQDDQAEQAFRTALELEPQNPAAALGLAQMLVNSKRIEEATQYFKTAAASDFVGAVAAYVGWARCERSLGDTDSTRSILDRGLEKYPGQADLLIEKANLAIDIGEYQLAVDTLAPEISGGSKRQDVNYVYATALRGIGDVDAATKHFEYADLATKETIRANQLIAEVSERPDDSELRFQIGSKHLQYGNTRDGLMWLESVLRLDPTHQLTHRALADYYSSRIRDDRKFIGLAQRHRMQAGPSASVTAGGSQQHSP